MEISFTFRNVEPSEAMKNYVREKLLRLQKYAHGPVHADVVFFHERHLHCVEISLNSGGQRYSGSHQGTDMYEAIDLALDKVTRQMRDQNDFWASDRRRSSPGWMLNGRYGGGNEY